MSQTKLDLLDWFCQVAHLAPLSGVPFEVICEDEHSFRKLRGVTDLAIVSGCNDVVALGIFRANNVCALGRMVSV